MGRIQAMITDVGSITGHMASVAREFRIPTLVGTGTGTRTIPTGTEITVDAGHAVVCQGRVEALLERKPSINPMKGSPIYKAVQTAVQRIAPLNLIDPEKENFTPRGCQTIHAIMSKSILRDPLLNDRLGGPSYALISHHYLNLNARLGYHFATIDTYCGPVINDN